MAAASISVKTIPVTHGCDVLIAVGGAVEFVMGASTARSAARDRNRDQVSLRVTRRLGISLFPITSRNGTHLERAPKKFSTTSSSERKYHES
ncbi:hypothetical protein HGG71_09000 [Rhodobacteraceae bacterium R_SAG2]|nr:hypothetical protein [Rhodobacteraceae bacterium R_SAG2]